MKQITCLLQGLTDEPLQDLGQLTPLQKAATPQLDALAQKGELFAAVPPEDNDSVESALLSLFGQEGGFDDVKRGPLEAYSLRYVLSAEQVAFSVRFVSLGQGVVVDVFDEILSDSEGKLLCSDLNAAMNGLGCHFLHLEGPRAVLISDHPALVAAQAAPVLYPLETVGKPWVEVLPKGEQSDEVRALMEKTVQVLQAHEINALREDLEEPLVNGLLLLCGGMRPVWSLPDNKKDYSQWLLYTTSAASAGVGKALGVEVWSFPPEQKKFEHVDRIIRTLDTFFQSKEAVVLDIPYLWRSTYKGDLLEKLKTIEWLDRHLVGPLAKYCDERSYRLTVLPLRHCDIRSGKTTNGAVPGVAYPAFGKSRARHKVYSEKLLEGKCSKVPLHHLVKIEAGK